MTCQRVKTVFPLLQHDRISSSSFPFGGGRKENRQAVLINAFEENKKSINYSCRKEKEEGKRESLLWKPLSRRLMTKGNATFDRSPF